MTEKRGDYAVFKRNGQVVFVGRVIGKSGDMVQIDSGREIRELRYGQCEFYETPEAARLANDGLITRMG